MSAPPPQQMLLDLGPPPAPSLGNFVAGGNAEVLHALAKLLLPDSESDERCVYLWGESGSGRSHLLRAMSSAAAHGGGRYYRCEPDSRGGGAVAAAEIRGAGESNSEPVRVWAIDDVENAGPESQIALFNLINEVRADAMRRKAIVVAGNSAPLALALREDLRTRLGWGLVFHLKTLSDEEKDAALARRAEERGVALPPEVRRYLLRNFARDLNSLMSLVGALDDYAMRHHRALTVPLLRELAQEQRNTVADAVGANRPA